MPMLRNKMAGDAVEINRSVPQKLIDWLFRDDRLSLNALDWAQLLLATLVVRNRSLMDDFSGEIVSKIDRSFADEALSDSKKKLIFYNSLSYFAFTSPRDGAVLSLGGVEYRLERINLTSGWLSAPYCAYGLKAIYPPNEQSILIFRGTTFPTDHGFLSGLLADTRPHGAIGSQLYARGQAQLSDWISREHERTAKRVMCTGQSLGGAMSLHCHVNQPDLVDFFVFNPPSLTHREKRILEGQALPPVGGDANVMKVVSHVNDPVLSLGSVYFPPGTTVFRHGSKQDSWSSAHARAVAFHLDDEEPQYEEHANAPLKRNILWKIVKPVLFICVLALHVIALPVRIIIQLSRKVAGYFNPSHADIPHTDFVLENKAGRSFEENELGPELQGEVFSSDDDMDCVQIKDDESLSVEEGRSQHGLFGRSSSDTDESKDESVFHDSPRFKR